MATEFNGGEPEAGPWRVAPLAELLKLLGLGDTPADRPRIVAIDGHSNSGKSTLAGRLRLAVPGAEVVHTDDIAWSHSRFGWDDLIIGGVLEPLHRGESVHYQPPAWERHGRTGHIDLSVRAPLVIVEGVGASRRDVSGLIDAAAWLQSDPVTAERRALDRDGDDAIVIRRRREWMVEENPFVAADRPWERVDVIVGGANQLDHDPLTEVVLSPPFRRSG